MSRPSVDLGQLANTLDDLLPLVRLAIEDRADLVDRGAISDSDMADGEAAYERVHGVLAQLRQAAAGQSAPVAGPGPQLFQLADDKETYGDDAGRWLIVSADGERELSGPMKREDADGVLRMMNTLGFIAGRAAHGKLYGNDMQGSAQSVLRDIESLANRALAQTTEPTAEPVRVEAPAGMTP